MSATRFSGFDKKKEEEGGGGGGVCVPAKGIINEIGKRTGGAGFGFFVREVFEKRKESIWLPCFN